jgi:outer membrane protein TolC
VQVAGRNRILLDATEAFWKWVETAQQLQINRDLLALALRRRAIVAQQVRIGEAPAIDSVEVALSVASRRSKVADAIRKAEQAGIKLAVFMWTDGGGAMDFRYRPPALPDAPNLSEEDAFDGQEIALDRRPEIQQVRVKLAQTRVEQRLARERLRPKLLLEAQAVSYEANPLDVSDFKLGVKIDQPLLFRGGRGDVEQTQVDVLQLDFKREITERKVLADVDAALVALRQAEARVDIAERRVELAGLLQEAEQRRFELGESTLFLVNQRESSFAQAREELVAARADALRAFAQYRWATGTISASPYDL